MTEVIDQFRGNYRFLSNFWESPVTVPEEMTGIPGFEYITGKTAKTVEHLYQASKATDRRDADYIIVLSTPKEAKSAGKQVRMREDFDEVKLLVMASLIESKFTQSEVLKEALLDTGDAKLVEGNTWGDTYWGVDLRSGVGQNNLGQLIMDVRRMLAND